MDIPRYCQSCGQKLNQVTASRLICPENHVTYLNPRPVVVMLVPQRHSPTMPNPLGVNLLKVKRRIPPAAGKWTFPGGFVEFGQTVQQACSAELQQETGVVVEPEYWTVLDAISTPGTGEILIFCKCPAIEDVLASFVPNDEVEQLGLTSITGPEEEELGFSLHQQVGVRFVSDAAYRDLNRLRPLQ